MLLTSKSHRQSLAGRIIIESSFVFIETFLRYHTQRVNDRAKRASEGEEEKYFKPIGQKAGKGEEKKTNPKNLV